MVMVRAIGAKAEGLGPISDGNGMAIATMMVISRRGVIAAEIMIVIVATVVIVIVTVIEIVTEIVTVTEVDIDIGVKTILGAGADALHRPSRPRSGALRKRSRLSRTTMMTQ